MDLQMPEMDGYQATAKLRSESRFKTLPIIAMTAHATMEERQRCLESGMNDHISKPIDPRVLFETVARFYKKQRSADFSPLQLPNTPEPLLPSIAPSNGIPAISGLDVEDGLFRVGGNQKLYLRLLRQFEEQQGDSGEQIASALAKGDLDTASRLAHTLKGVAGNVGAKTVHIAAAHLEKLIRDQAAPEDLKQAREQVAVALDELIAQMRVTLAPEIPAQAPATATDPAQSREAAAQLNSLLGQFDPGAADFIETHKSYLRPLFTSEEWAQLMQHAESYSFEECQDVLEKAVK
jgi:CheY-like chemotaxis protein